MEKEIIDLQPTLTGDLIELRPLRPDDFDALFSAASDPLIWEQHPEGDRYQRDVFQKYFDGALESNGAFAIIERKSGGIIGSSRYCNLDLTNREVEIGWTFLKREFWGGTYNRELKQLMLDHAFRFVDRVLFVVGENNLRSQKALEKIGARFIKKVESLARDRTPTPSVVFVITRETYRLRGRCCDANA
jgi:N-acetyltransferase